MPAVISLALFLVWIVVVSSVTVVSVGLITLVLVTVVSVTIISFVGVALEVTGTGNRFTVIVKIMNVASLE